MKTEILHSFPWPLIPAVIGFLIAAIVQVRLRHHIDREKVIQTKDLKDLYPRSIPPRHILTPQGRKLYRWFYAGLATFMGFLLLTMFLYAK